MLASTLSAQFGNQGRGDETSVAKPQPMLVEVDGHKVEILTEGSRSPTVVLESGFGATTDFWQKVQGPVSSFAMVVSYDRAGVGKSELAGTPRTAGNIARELRSALREAHLAPPYLLVGHSIGSFYIRVFAHTYPNEVCGMVFVDPVPEGFYEWMRVHQAEAWKQMEAASAQLPEGLRNELAGKDESAEQARKAWPLPKALGLVLAGCVEKFRILTALKIDTGGAWLDVPISALVLSAGTEGVNSILKFFKYSKEDKKATAAAKDPTGGVAANAAASVPTVDALKRMNLK